jgi:hypothetical protein
MRFIWCSGVVGLWLFSSRCRLFIGGLMRWVRVRSRSRLRRCSIIPSSGLI